MGTNTTAHTTGKATMTVTASLAAPAELSNSGITASSFTANWAAVVGAASYLVDVATDPSFDRGGGGVLVDEGFDDGTNLAEGWTVESGALGGVYDSNGNYGKASPSLKLSSTVTLSTPALSHPLDISFWYKGNGSSFTSTLVVEQLVGGSWTAVSEAEISGKAATYSHDLDPAATQVRFVFTKNSGNVALDDVQINGVAGDSTLVVDGESVTGTAYTAEALDTATYYWRVQAVGNAKGPYSATEEVTLNADPTAPPSIRAIDDIEIEVGETATATVKVSAPEEAPATVSITSGDAAAKLGEDGVFSFAPEAVGVYPFTITAVNANGSAKADFTVTADLAEPETPETPAVIGFDSFTAEWEAIPGAESYELVVIEGKGGSSGGGGGGSGETKTETFAKASFSTAGGSYANQTISDGDLGTWTATQCRGDQGGVPTVGGTGTLTSPEIAGGVSAVEFDYSWPFAETATGDIDLYVGGAKVSSASVTGGTPGTASYSFSPVSGATTIEFANTYATAKKLRISFNEIRITTASGKSIARAVGDVIYSNNVGNVTSFDVTGLQPNTEYTFAFRAIAGEEATEWSEPVSVTTADGPAAPSWTTIPEQSAAVGYPFSIDLSAYVSGVPTPTLALTAGTAELTGTVLSFTPDALGEYTFTVTASNSSGDPADATFTVTAVDHVPTKYAVCVGINEYAEISGLEGCVNDSIYIESSLIERGGWLAENVVRLNDSKATKAAIRSAIAAVAAKAQAGDTFVYQHSSHGGQFNDTTGEIISNETGKATFLCVYDEDYDDNTTAYNDYEIAADMAAFNAGVKVAVIVDACHSGGLFKSKEEARAAAASFDLAGRVTAIMDADRAQRKARGENVAKTLASSEIGWATACEYYETSYDGGFFHTDEWLTNPSYGDEYWVGDDDDGYYNYPASYKQGGVFTTSAAWGWWNGDADTDSEAGDNDGLCDAYEFWKAGYDFCSVVGEFWWDEPEYNYYPQCTNIAVLKSIELGRAGMPTLDAPVANAAADVTASSFTASWSAVEEATGYRIQVATDESFSTGAVSDPLTADDFLATSTTYVEFSGVTKNSDAVYAGKTSKHNSGAIQLNNKADKATGIWTTSSGGKATRVTVDWNSATSSGRSVEIYGSATPLNSYSAVKAATSLGTIDYGSGTSLDITEPCAYVGILANGGALYLNSVTIDWGSTGSGSSIVLDQEVGNVTSFEVTGLEAETAYWYRVQALSDIVDSDFSNVISLTTEAGEPYAPVWSEIPDLAAVAGEMSDFDASDYVAASPSPLITLVSVTAPEGVTVVEDEDYQFEDGYLVFTPPAEGSYVFEFLAENELDDATATLTVVAAGAPVTVPDLTLSNATASSFDASWTACTGVSGYTLQVATDDQFSAGSAGGEVELFANAAATPATAPEGWTYSLTATDTKYLLLGYPEDSVVSEAVSSKGLTSLTLAFEIRTYGTITAGTTDTALIEYLDGSTWKELGTVQAANKNMAKHTVDAAACIGLDGLRIRWTCPGASGKKGVGIQNLVLSGEGSGGDGSLVKELTVEGTTKTVDGLEPETLYYARVKGAADWSEVQSITTLSDSPTAPAWLDLPAQTATVGLEFGIDLSTYVTGSPFPTITVDGIEAEDGNWTFTPDEAGEFTFELVATNTEGSDSATLTVVVSPAPAAKYALCVGLNEYDYAAWEAQGWGINKLNGCVNDATYLKKNLVERGGWADADVTLLTNATATKDALRAAIAAAAAKAKAGDTFVYQHSSHGLNNDDPYGKDVALATYAAPYEDFELAEDLAAFADGVKVVIAIDACHSAGMFKKGAVPAASFNIAARVSALMDANRTARKARGEDVSRNLSSDQVGWITAADFDETSKDGGYYDTDEWILDDDAEGEESGGTFLSSFTWGWWSGKADVSGDGDGDGWFDAYEGWSFATPVCADYDHTPQFLNEDVLRSVELGWIGEAAPSEAIVFDPVPGVSVAIGEEATLTVVAKNADGTTDGITLSIVATDPEGLEYDFADGTLAFTPAEDGIFLFTVQAVNGGESATKLLGVSAALPAPVAQDATDITESGFTANWTGVEGAQSYQLQVSTTDSFPIEEPDELIEEGFDGVTSKDTLPEEWAFEGTFDTYPSSGGEAPPSIKLSKNGATLTTPEFKLNMKGGLVFWTKGNGSGTNMTSVLKVEQLVGEDWLEVDSFVPSTAAKGETKQYENVDKNATRFRFVMVKPTGAVGNIAIDDVKVLTLKAGAALVVDESEIDAEATSFAVDGLKPGTTYYYRIRAIGNSKSAWSETIEVTTLGEAPIPVPDLSVFVPEQNPDTALFALWLCEGATEFRLQVATDEGFGAEDLVFDEELAESSKLVTGLTPETTYYVRVCAEGGEWSNVESLTTAASGGETIEIPIDSETFPTLGFSGGLSGSADTVFASDYMDVEAIYATWNGTDWVWAKDDDGNLIVLQNEAAWPTVQIPYPAGVNSAIFRLRFLPQGN